MVLVYFSGRKECGREIRLVRRIGKMLHLYCNPFLRPVRTSRAIQRRIGYTIGGIYLCSRLITPHYQDSAAAFVSEFNKIFLKFSRLPVIEDPALTVSSANIQRREIRIYVTPDFFWHTKIHWSSIHVINLSGRDMCSVYRKPFASLNLQDMVKNRSGISTTQIPIGMVREIHYCICIAYSPENK